MSQAKIKSEVGIRIQLEGHLHAKLKAEAASKGINLYDHIVSVLRRHALGSGK